MVKLGYTIIYVSDVEKALLFYEQAFGMKRRFITAERDYGELLTGETTLSFAAHALGKSNFPGEYISVSDSEHPLGIEIALVTEDIDAVHGNAITHGAVELQPPGAKPWGQTVSYIRCPSGILIELCTSTWS